MVDRGINFRSTLAYVTDGTDEAYCSGYDDGYPTSRGGFTFGWESGTPDKRNRNSSIDRRLAGTNRYDNTGAQAPFRLDLGSTGSKNINLAIGGYSDSTAYSYVQIKDDTSVIATYDISGGLSSDEFMDANGDKYSSANWPGSFTLIQHTFTSQIFRLIIGSPSSESGTTSIAHAFVGDVAAGSTAPPTTVAPTTLAPTTLAPTTLTPTTLAPTTIAPTTIAPTTLAPTSLAPTTIAPTTLVPTTAPPQYYETCFSDYSLGSPPSDWTEYWHTTSFSLDVIANDGLGAQELHFDQNTTNQRCAAGWDTPGSVQDSEVLVKVKFTLPELGYNFLIGPGVRLSGGSTTEDGYVIFMDVFNDQIILRRYNNGVGSTDLATHAHNIIADTWFWIRLRIVGSVIKAKVWTDGSAEGGTWDIDYTDGSPYSAAGYCGLSSYNKDGWCDWISVATAGGTAQGPEDISGCTTVAPTTAVPTTAAPTTTPPTTAPPTTYPPTTAAPTTLAPTTSSPTTLVATTEPPTSVPPTTDFTTFPPTTAPPTSAAPTTSPPTSAAPTTSAPTTSAPTTVAPTTIVVTTSAPTTSAPTTSAPTTVAVTTLAPTTLAPTSLAPTTVGPTTVPPTTLAPSTTVPTTAGPTVPPTTNVPEYICVKELMSTIIADMQLKSYMIENAQLDSHITDEMRIHGNLC